jgi:hypothetical protein
MKSLVLACLCLVVLPLHAQNAAPVAPAAAACAQCGVIRSIQEKVKQERLTGDQVASKPSGLVATVPLGGGGKMQVGPSQKLGKEAVISEKSWDVVVRLDDGRVRVVSLDRQPEFQLGDRVRIDGNRLAAPSAVADKPKPH